MPRGLNRTDLNTTGVSYKDGTPVTTPHEFGNPVVLPKNFGNISPFDPGNPVLWTPASNHFGNTFGVVSDQNLQMVTATFSSATILAMNTTPVILIPGIPGSVITLLWWTMQYKPFGNPYSNPNSASFRTGYNAGGQFPLYGPSLPIQDSSGNFDHINCPLAGYVSGVVIPNGLDYQIMLDHAVTLGQGSWVGNFYYLVTPVV